MQLHQTIGSHKRARRIGRGGKRGTTSGRGTKGQRSRSGHRIRPAFRDLLIRIPKLRGYKNLPKRSKPFVVSLGTLCRKLKAAPKGAPLAVDLSVLKTAKIVPARHAGAVKILGDGAAAFPLALKGLSVSSGARKKIEAAGGSVI